MNARLAVLIKRAERLRAQLRKYDLYDEHQSIYKMYLPSARDVLDKGSPGEHSEAANTLEEAVKDAERAISRAALARRNSGRRFA